MKQFHIQVKPNLYYAFISGIIVIMTAGLLLSISSFDKHSSSYVYHSVLVIFFSICLLLYPKHETHIMRIIIVITGTVYFYMLLFLYPETWSTFILICFIPVLSIMFFDIKLFYFSFLLNGIAITVTLSCTAIMNQGDKEFYLVTDLAGTIINFIGSQAMVLFVFYLTFERIKKQQYYYEQIQQSERLKTTSQIAAAVAHEIRNPLTVVKGFLQFYEKDTSLNDNVKRNFSLMINELDTAEHVISHFLTIAKPEKDKKIEKVDVKAALQSVTDLLKFYGILHNNKITLNVQDHLYIAANIIEFKQLIVNLVKNAIEASSIGDSITVGAERKDDYVEIKLIDNGCGMSEEELKSLGTPFYSLKSKGTGLGMMICFNIIEKYHGTIHFDSVKGKGTTATIRFPLKKD